MRFNEVEKILLADGWRLKAQAGSHRQYVHPTKPGKVTAPDRWSDINPYIVKKICQQAGINEKRTE